jgi:uncharacterized protein YndB with AHSA1/START domain
MSYSILARLLPWVVLACVLSWGGTAALAQPSVRVPPTSGAEYDRLQSGEILVDARVDGRTMHGTVTAVVDATPARVWAVVTDFAAQDRWVPDMADAHVVRSEGQYVIGQAVTEMPFPLRNRTWQIRIHSREERVGGTDAYVSSWTYVEGSGEMLEHQGYWLVMPLPSDAARSLVRYQFIVNPDVAAPDGMVRRSMRRTLPGVLQGLRRRVAR